MVTRAEATRVRVPAEEGVSLPRQSTANGKKIITGIKFGEFFSTTGINFRDIAALRYIRPRRKAVKDEHDEDEGEKRDPDVDRQD